MYRTYNMPYQNNDSRLIGGGFLGPFILGGITGGVVAPYFWNNNKNNYYYPYPPRPVPYYQYYTYY